MTITVWSKPQCVQCKAVYRALDAVPGLRYNTKNLPDYPQKLEEFKAQGHMQAPVVEAEGFETFAGFNPDALAAIVAAYGLGEPLG